MKLRLDIRYDSEQATAFLVVGRGESSYHDASLSHVVRASEDVIGGKIVHALIDLIRSVAPEIGGFPDA